MLCAHGMAAEVEWVEADRDDGHINIRSSIIINAPSARVYDALLEYDQFAELSDAYAESRYIEPAEDGAPRIYTRIEGCIWFFCRSVERYARLELNPKWQISAIAEPDQSDAELSIETWTLTSKGESTHIDYTHELETGFWVPPLIGIWVIRSTVSRSALKAAKQIEMLAQQ